MHREVKEQLDDAASTAESQSAWSRPAGLREALVVALPLMVSTLSWTVMNFIDRLMLFDYDPKTLGAALAGGTLAFTVICFPLGLASYVATFVAQYHGARNYARIGPMLWQAIWVGVVATPLAIAAIPVAPWVFSTFGDAPSLVPLEVAYFNALSYSGGAIVLSGAMSGFFSGRGQTRVVMFVDLAAAAVNIVLDYCWIYGNWGFPQWGIAGAGWATTVALWLKPIVYLYLLWRPQLRAECATGSGWRFDRQLSRRLWAFGTAGGLQMAIEVGAFAVFILFLGRISEEAQTITGLAFNINNFAFMPVWGVGMAATTIVGRRLGENRSDLAARATWSCLVCGGGYMAVLCALYLFAPHVALAAHHGSLADSPAMRAQTIVLLRFLASFGLIDAVNIIFAGALKGAGDVMFVMLASAGIALACVAVSYAGVVQGLGLYWWWAVLTAWVVALAAAFGWRFLYGPWRSMRVIEPAIDQR